MSIYVNNQFRIKRSLAQQDAMQRLISAKIFDQYKDILMISAIIGYNEKRYIPIEKNAPDGVLMQFFSQKDYDVIDLIAYAHEKKQSIIKEDKKYDIFANYANGGFPILLEKLEIDLSEDILEEDARKALVKYYSLLLSNGFKRTEVTREDLFI